MDAVEKAVTPQGTDASEISKGDVRDIDQAALFLASAADTPDFPAKAEKRLKRKIDFIMLPMVSNSSRNAALQD